MAGEIVTFSEIQQRKPVESKRVVTLSEIQNKPPVVNESGSFADAVGQGFFGAGDEAGAALAATALKVAPESLGGAPSGTPWKDLYEDAYRTTSANLESYKEREPGKALAGEIAGSVIAPGGLFVKGAKYANRALPEAATKLGNLGQKAATYATIGGAEGFAYGLGQGDPGNRVSDAVGPAITGAVTAPAAVAGMNVLSNVFKGIKEMGQAAYRMWDPESAEMQVVRHLEMDGIDPITAARKFDELGPAAVIADLGDNTRGLLDTTTLVPGPARQRVNQMLDARQGERNKRVTQAAYRELGDADKFYDNRQTIARERAAKAKPAYDKAYQIDIAETDSLANILDRPVMDRVWREANKIAQIEGREFPEVVVFENVYGKARTLSTEALDMAKRGLDSIIRRGTDPVTGKPKDDKVRALINLRTEFLKEIDKQNPAYAKARRDFADSIRLEEAMDMGLRFFRDDSEMTRSVLRGMTPDEQEFFRMGAAKAIRDKILGAADGADAYKRIFGNDLTRERIKAIMPSEAAYDRFRRDMENEAEYFKTRAAVQGNSRTVERGQNLQELTDPLTATTQAATGDFMNAINTMGRVLQKRRVSAGRRAEQIAKILTTMDPRELDRVRATMIRAYPNFTRITDRAFRIADIPTAGAVGTALSAGNQVSGGGGF